MSEFCKQFLDPIRDGKITPEEAKKMLMNKAWVTCSLPSYDEIYYHYKQSNSMQKTADHFNVSKKMVHDIVHRFQ